MKLDWGTTFSVVLVGLVVVFAALLILILFVWLMGKIFQTINSRKAKAQEQKEQDARRQAQQAMESQAKAEQTEVKQVEDGISPEVVAAISAAVAVVMDQAAPGVSYTISRLQRAGTGRSAWGNAGLAAQLSPFDR